MDLNSNNELQLLENTEIFKFVGRHKFQVSSVLFFAAIPAQLFEIFGTILCIDKACIANFFIREIIKTGD